jgi:hypothetical protein
MAYLNGPQIVRDGLVLYLDAGNRRSYPGSGTSWTDLTGNGNNGTLTNGPAFNSENLGSISFDGVNDFVTTGETFNAVSPINGFFADASSTWSVSSWFRPDTSNATAGAVIAKAGGTGTAATLIVWETGTTLNTRLRGGTILAITTNMNTAWHEVVLTWDGTTARVYYDGSFVNTISIGTAAVQTQALGVGAAALSGTPNTFMLGRTADLKVYNRPLTALEVTQNYNALRSRFGV